MMNATVDDPAATAPPPGGSAARRLLAGLLVPAAHRRDRRGRAARTVPGGISAAAGRRLRPGPASARCPARILARSAQRVALWQVAFGALAPSVALTAARIGDEAAGGAPGRPRRGHPRRAAASSRSPCTCCSPCPTAGWPAGPGGSAPGWPTPRRPRSGLALAIAGRPFPAWAVGAGLAAGRGAARCPPCGCATWRRPARDRQRMQWMAVGAVAGRRLGAGGRGPARARRLAGPGRRRGGRVRVAASRSA